MKNIIAPLIPAYQINTEDLSLIVEGIPKSFEIPLVVYNNEEKNFYRFLKSLEDRRVITMLDIPFQVGKSEAVRLGLKFMLRNPDINTIIQIDCRNKQPIYQVENMVNFFIENDYHMVIANRYKIQPMDGQMHRIAISTFLSKMIKYIAGYDLKDTVCGMRVYCRKLAHSLCSLLSFGYGLELEEIFIARHLGFNVGEFPVISNKQKDSTNAEKIEDNLHVIIMYARKFSVDDHIISLFNFILFKIKSRESFEVNCSYFDSESIRFDYIDRVGSIISGYTNQEVVDAYKVSFV